MKKKLLLGALLLLSITSFGIPAKRGLRTVTQPDGTVLTVQKIGDEHAHYYVTSDNILLQKDEDGFFKYAIAKNGQLTSGDVIAKDPAARTNAEMQYVRQIDQSSLFKTAQSNRQKNMARRNSFSRSAAFPSKGEVNGLVLLVEFNDVRFKTANPQAAFTNHLNQENYTLNNATGSVRDYFIDQSSGSFRPKFDTYGPITLKKNMALYGGNDNYGDDADPAGMVVDACQLAASQFGVDFSKYDLDNNGIVDLVYVIYAGYGEAQSGIEDNIWPHAWDILGGGYKLNLNGKDIRSYACSSELSGFTGTTLDGIGTLCHEFSHCLGLPDLYDTSRIPSGLNFGMGEWDVMDFGSYNNDSKTPAGYSAYEKSFVGWMKLQELINPASVTLNPLSDSNEAYVIHSEQNRDEFFVFENRQLNKWDEYLPAAGLLITHVDYNQTIWNNNAVNNEAGRQRVTLVPADNKLLVYNNNNQQYFNSLLGDPYPGSTKNTAFTDNSTPAAVLNNGTKLGKPVTEITHSKGVVTFEFLKDFVSTPKALPATDIRSNGFTANWEAVEGATGYSLNISPVINGEKIISEDFDKFTRGSESNPDGTDIGSKLDNYMQQAGWSGEKIYQAGKSCKIGSNSTKGHLITPALNLSAGNGVITVYYTVKGKSGLSQGIKLSLTSDAAGNSPFEEISRNLSTSAKRECVVFKQAPTNAYLKFKLFAVGYLDDFAVYSGDVSAQEPVALRTAVQMPILIENIQETAYQISGLTPGTTYAYNVLATKDGNKSEWSAPVNVTTDYSTGLADTKEALQLYVNGNQLIINGYKGKQAVLYDFSGKILRSQLLDSDMTTLVCEKGFYLVRIGTQTAKIHIGE